jgi:hypothetical protein
MARDYGRDAVGAMLRRGNADELARLADGGDRDAAFALARVLVNRGQIDQLRARAARGDRPAQCAWIDWLAEQGDLVSLTRLADGEGGVWAKTALARLLIQLGDLEGLAARADAGDGAAHGRLLAVLAERGDTATLARRAEGGDESAAEVLRVYRCLAADNADNADGAEDAGELPRLTDLPGGPASIAVAQLLLAHGRIAELYASADRGNMCARMVLQLGGYQVTEVNA